MGIYSKHTFMFPFQWDYISSKNSDNYNDRTDLLLFDKLFKKADNGFKSKKFQIGNEATKYNEYNYFHAFARKALYYTEGRDILRYYEIDEVDGEFNIEYYEESLKKIVTLNLNLDSICLHVYDTGVGIVSFNISNNKYVLKKDILTINEYGRRLYPQYMNAGSPLAAKKSYLAHRIYGKIGNLLFDEDFTAYSEWIDVDEVFMPPSHIRIAFGYKQNDKLGDVGLNFVFSKKQHKKDTIRIRQVTDDRMFFLCYYNNRHLANSMSETHDNDQGIKRYLLDDFWYAFLYGDKGDPSVKNDELQMKHIKEHSYTRWLDNNIKNKDFPGSIYGITRDSFVCLGGWDLISIHMQTMYYQMAVLCLVQRATILRFSWEISQITSQIFRNRNKTDNAIQELYENYIRFINQIYFREVTAQIQGIELYNLFQKSMNLEKEAKDLDSEMQELYNYLNVKEQGKLARVADTFLPVTLLAGILGMNTIDFESYHNELFMNIINALLFLYVIYAFYILISNKLK